MTTPPDQRVVIVTGSSSGIGEGIARRYGAMGWAVVVNSRSSVEAGRKLATSLPEAIYVQGDIASTNDCQQIVDAGIAAFGRVDMLVNNAGVTRSIPHEDFEAVTPEVWQTVLGTNLVGTWNMTVCALPHLKASGNGCVINISSLSGQLTAGSCIPYAVSKAGLNHMTRLLARVVGPEVRVNAIAPGFVDTPWTAKRTASRSDRAELTPLQRVATTDDVADLVVAVESTAFLTGQIVVLDGGIEIGLSNVFTKSVDAAL